MLCHNFCARESKPESHGGSYEATPGGNETPWFSLIKETGPVSLQSAKSIDKKSPLDAGFFYPSMHSVEDLGDDAGSHRSATLSDRKT